jgi:hypothetical protein
MVVEPVVRAVAWPFDPGVLLIFATDGLVESQLTVVVRSCVLLSVYVPGAVNCWFVPLTIEGFFGVTLMDTSAAAVTVSIVEPLMEPEAA